jgi:hypothetical protein
MTATKITGSAFSDQTKDYLLVWEDFIDGISTLLYLHWDGNIKAPVSRIMNDAERYEYLTEWGFLGKLVF